MVALQESEGNAAAAGSAEQEGRTESKAEGKVIQDCRVEDDKGGARGIVTTDGEHGIGARWKALVMSFTLPPSSYATMMVREV